MKFVLKQLLEHILLIHRRINSRFLKVELVINNVVKSGKKW